MATPPAVEVVTVASVAPAVAPAALAVTIATLQTSRERVVGVVRAASAPVGTAAGAVRPLDAGAPARLLRGTPVWVSGAARLAVLLAPVHGWSPVLVDVTRPLRDTPVWLSHAAGRTLVHSASATVVVVLDVVVR
jgi:hypothetical protein